jgi:hypothetical protein
MVLAGALAAWLAVAPPRVNTAERPNETEVTAALVFNFGKYVEWPEEPSAARRMSHDICVFRENPVYNDLAKLTKGKNLKGMSVRVRKINLPAEAPHCRVLYIGAADQSNIEGIHRALGRAAVLTVSDASGYLERGGMIRLQSEDNEVHFEVNLRAATQNGLKISSRLLQLATRVLGVEP